MNTQKIKNKLKRGLPAAALPLLLLPSGGCFTGIEGTKRIDISREDRKLMVKTPEDTFLNQIGKTYLKNWKPGKVFIVSDNRLPLLFDQPPAGKFPEDTSGMTGRHLRYAGLDSRKRPDGSLEGVILLSDVTKVYRLPVGKEPERMMDEVTGHDLPMLIDADAVARADRLMTGKELWIKTSLWYDLSGNRISGRKFVPLTVARVEPGTMVFPLRVVLKDTDGNLSVQYMNMGDGTHESRSFAKLFSLTDPRRNYPAISEEHWKLIQEGRIETGMTKEECRLSLGNPTNVDSGHDHNSAIDIWQYDNGLFLRFEDGLLVTLLK